MAQASLFDHEQADRYQRPKSPLLKWIGSKYRHAQDITRSFPQNFGTFYDVFLGSGPVLATVAPSHGVGADSFAPLIEIWQALQRDPAALKSWYAERWHSVMAGDKIERYEEIKASYNAAPNGADFLFLTRACYGGVVRFRKADGYMSTPCGAHRPISPESFATRVEEWHRRLRNCTFICSDFRQVMRQASDGDLIYCDPPYKHTQAIVYGAQDFSLHDLFAEIRACKDRGVRVALSIDGTKKSGTVDCDVGIPDGLFERTLNINCGRSMLKRFQMNGKTLEKENVTDRLLLTY